MGDISQITAQVRLNIVRALCRHADWQLKRHVNYQHVDFKLSLILYS